MNDDEVEKAMLFFIIFKGEQYNLTEKDFLDARHKLIIKAINELKLKKEDVTLITVNNKINRKGVLEYLSKLGDYLTLEKPEDIYLKLKEYTKRREMFDLLKTNQIKIQNEDNIDLYIENLINQMQKIEFQTEKDESFMNQVIEAVEQIETNMNKKEDYSLYTGFLKLDDYIDGLHNGELTVIGARPRSWENNIYFTNSGKYRKKRKECNVRKPRNEFDSINTKANINENRRKFKENQKRRYDRRRV